MLLKKNGNETSSCHIVSIYWFMVTWVLTRTVLYLLIAGVMERDFR